MAITGSALRSNFGQLKRPYKLTFSITYWCQSRCTHCNIWEIKPKGELSLDEIKQFAQKNDYFRWIEITGGEPFMRSDIVDIVKAFHETSKDLYLLTIPTNSLSNHDMIASKIEQMLQLGIPRVVITLSLDGYREMHDRVRGIPGNFDKVIDMYRRLSELKKRYKNLYFYFGYTIINMNQGQFEKCFEGVRAEIPTVTYNDFHINVGQTSDIYYSNTNNNIVADRGLVADEIKSVMKKRKAQFDMIKAVQNTLEDAFLKKLVQYVETNEPPMKSRSLDASLFMDSYGNVYPSIMWGRRIGNIKDSEFSLGPIWQSQEADEVRKLIKEGKEPRSWTACEAYQTLSGDIKSLL